MIRSIPRAISISAAVAALAVAVPGRAAAVSADLFFSEYIEGSSNNKALEIVNLTGATVNLAAGGYNIQMHFNGNPVATLTINLTGTAVAHGDVYVVAQSSANAAILAQADQTNGSGWFNGNDAVVLRKGTTVLDVIGQIGFNPGIEWGTGLTSTADNTLRRDLINVTDGDTNGLDVFNPADEWNGFANDTVNGLGCINVIPCPTTPPPPPVLKEIFEIQGNGLASPFADQNVESRDNVVTAVTFDGFFIQTPDDSADADPETSNGIFVFTGNSVPAVQVGDQVDVIGMVAEFFNMTEIDLTTLSIDAFGVPLPAIALFDPTTPSPDQPQPATEMERYEGMIVRVEDGIVSSPTNQFGEASVVAGSERAFREPGIAFPGLPGLPVWDGNPEIFEIDTDRFAASPGLLLAAGATVTAEGPLAFSFSDYQIWPTALEFEGDPAVVPVRSREDGEFTVGSQNFLRLFDTVNDPDIDDDVPTPQQYAARLAKLSLHVRTVLGAPDILAVQEVENLTALQGVADQIHADDSSLNYTAHLLEGNDIGGIDVGFLVRDTVEVDSVEQFGADDVFVFGSNPPAPLNDRPPLVLRGSYVGNGAAFPIVVVDVHQRSLSGIDGSDGARIRAKRHEQALRLAELIQSLQEEPGARLIVIGDFNAFEFTDGYVDVMGQVTGSPDPGGALLPVDEAAMPSPALTNQTLNMPEDQRYSFVFDGTAQSLDHAITSQTLDPLVRGAEHSRGNADAPFAFAGDPTTALRSSDHDGTVVFLFADSDADGVADEEDLCAGTEIPEGVPTQGLGVNRYALVDGDTTFDTVLPPGGGAGQTFTVADTAGCSCEQIIDELALGAGHVKKGCSAEAMEAWIASLP